MLSIVMTTVVTLTPEYHDNRDCHDSSDYPNTVMFSLWSACSEVIVVMPGGAMMLMALLFVQKITSILISRLLACIIYDTICVHFLPSVMELWVIFTRV